MGSHRMLTPHRRAAIEGEIEMCLTRVDLLVRRLDRFDAPFEDLEEDDPGGGNVEDEGEQEGGRLRPIYGVDQSAGPLNEHSAIAAHRAAELGLVRSPTGGWRYP